MTHLEKTDNWQQILEQKDTLPLRELAKQFDTTPGAISAALKRTATARVVVGRDGAAEAKSTPRRRIVRPEAPEPAPAPAATKKKRRAPAKQAKPSKADWWTEAVALLDTMSMVEVAAQLGVSPGKIAVEMRRTGTTRKPVVRPIEPKKAKKRVKRAPAAPKAQAAPKTTPKVVTTYAWRVVIQDATGERDGVIIASSLVEAAEKAAKVAGDSVSSLQRISEVIA